MEYFKNLDRKRIFKKPIKHTISPLGEINF